ncbi:MAG: DUF4350 domain-containing protein, partial [Pyrinomonadaceae bacterium]
MRQKLGLIVTIVAVVGLLVAINSVTYVSEEEKRDSEVAPNRSTYHAGPTGTRALYDLLNESGYGVMRWRDIPEKLLSEGQKVQTFVIIGDTKISINEEEAESLLLWVERGGRLVLVDRRPEELLLPTSGEWAVTAQFISFPTFEVDPGSVEQMVQDVEAVSPVQPTLLTSNVAEVLPSRFAGMIEIAPKPKPSEKAEHSLPFGFDEDEEESPS